MASRTADAPHRHRQVVIPRISGRVGHINATMRVAAATLVMRANPRVDAEIVVVHDKQDTRVSDEY